jgi:uncharacterized protein YbjT (DUF2867 family)
MFGRGSTRLQPVYVEDVAEAVARCAHQVQTLGTIFECGGPRIYSYSELIKAIAREVVLRPILFSNALCGVARVGLFCGIVTESTIYP